MSAREVPRRAPWALALGLLLTSCAPATAPAYFVPPSPGPTSAAGLLPAGPGEPASTLSATSVPTPIPPSPTPECTDDLDYVQDLTIPDGSLVTAGQLVDKRWQVRNSGSCNWDSRYSLRLVSGDAMGANSPLALYPARAGADGTLQIVFTAPKEPGTYECQWQAVNPDGLMFGDTIYMQIAVGG